MCFRCVPTAQQSCCVRTSLSLKFSNGGAVSICTHMYVCVHMHIVIPVLQSKKLRSGRW